MRVRLNWACWMSETKKIKLNFFSQHKIRLQVNHRYMTSATFQRNLCKNVKATKSYFVFVVPDQLSDAVSVL